MTTRTSTHTTTRVHTAVHLTDVIMGSIAGIVADLGLSSSHLADTWDDTEAALRQWISEGSLKSVLTICTQPDGTKSPIIEFPVRYSATGTADARFVADRASLARWRAKLDRVPARTTYQFQVTFRTAHTSMDGWGPASPVSTGGMRSYSFGTIAGAPHASASLRYHTT